MANTSSMAERVWRVSEADSERPTVKAGKISAAPLAASSPGIGSARNSTQNSRISSGPSQIVGSARPESATSEATLSKARPRRAAENTPSGSENSQAKQSAAAANFMVLGSASL